MNIFFYTILSNSQTYVEKLKKILIITEKQLKELIQEELKLKKQLDPAKQILKDIRRIRQLSLKINQLDRKKEIIKTELILENNKKK